MRLLRKSLKNKLIISYVGITFLALVMVGGIFYGFIQRYASQKEAEVIETSAQQVASELIKYIGRNPALSELELFFNSVESLQNIEIKFMSEDGTSFFDVYSSDQRVTLDDSRLNISGMMQTFGQGQFAASNGNQPWRGQQNIKISNQPTEKKDQISGTNILPIGIGGTELLIGGNEIEGFLVIANSSDVRMGIIQPALVAFGSASAIALLLSGLLGWWMGRRLSSPIVALSRAVGGMREGDLSMRADLDGKKREDEIGLLTDQFNSMAERLEITVDDLETERDTLKNFLSDASHELRTPLTALISYLELLEGRGGQDSGRRSEYVLKGKHQAERIKLIVANLLELSRMENKETEIKFSNYQIGNILNDAIQTTAGGDNANNLKIEMDLDDNVLKQTIFCNYSIVRGMLQNVIGNSIKFSLMKNSFMQYPEAEDAAVSVNVILKNNNAVFHIEDNGPGVPEADLPRVFDRFFRSTAQSIEGSGLGLAIVKSGASLHHGSVSLSNKRDGEKVVGTIFEIVLPLVQTHKTYPTHPAHPAG